MKSFTVIPILVLLVAGVTQDATAAVQQSIVPGQLRDATATDYTAKPCDGTRSAACTSCNQIKVCVTSDATMDAANPVQDCPAAAPFCSMSASTVGGVCQKTADTAVASCATAKTTFKCTGVGSFADPNSCQLYHYCSGPGATPDNYDCPTGYKFSGKVDACTLSSTACPTVTCKSDLVDPIYLPLPDKQFYVYCAYDRTATPAKLTDMFTFSCGSGSVYDPTVGKCVFTCPKEGLFVNSAIPAQYFQCYYSGGKLIYKDLVCAAGQKFDETTKRCIAAK